MIRLIQIILFVTLIFANDGEGPLFTNIIPIADFYYGNSLQINTQAIDKDGIEEIILYYRFNNTDSYKNITMKQEIDYYATIPAFEVNSTKIEYYFLGTDKFGNQGTFPTEGDNNPLESPILKSLNEENYEVNLIEPLNESISENISIIILSIYNRLHQNNLIFPIMYIL